jgi:integrase
LRVRPTGAMTWVYRYRIEGGPQRRLKLGVYPAMSADEARRHALEAAAEVVNGIDVLARQKTKRKEIDESKSNTLKAFIDEHYEPWAKTHLTTAAFQLKRIRSDFEDWLPKPMNELDIPLAESWRGESLRKGTQPVTVNRNLQRVHAVLSKAVQWKKFIVQHPFKGLKQLKHDRSGRVRYLEEDEEECLREALRLREAKLREERDRFNKWRLARHKPSLPLYNEYFVDHLQPLILLALNTGLRRGELFNLTWKDVNLRTKWLTVVGQTAKTKQTRRVPLNLEAVNVFECWHRQSKGALAGSKVFPGKRGKRLTDIKKSWGSLRKLAALSDFNFHDFRHHFASRLVQSGVDLNTVRELLGHSDIKMVLRYAHLAPGGLANAVEKVARMGLAQPRQAA